ncbi:MAG: capsular exopolysaccharide family protein [Candidatus Frackibacter sp. T328-2]|nr:MAG: capsular exopolysaccharide family protein [Candidatus Frackibacter sp. T328-2]
MEEVEVMSDETKRRVQSRDRELVVRHNPKSPLAESYRTLRTNIRFLSPDDPLQTIAMTSSTPSEGKSITIANLAISMTQNGQEVIIIDTDLRKPMQHRFFKMTNFAGLSNILTNEIELKEGIRETGVERLKLVSSGSVPPNPSELLSSKKMTEVIEEVEELADIVLLDCPPIIAVSDPMVIANKVDGVILVVASHETEDKALVKAKEMLDKVQANIIGTILTKYRVGESKGYYSGYYHYYG